MKRLTALTLFLPAALSAGGLASAAGSAVTVSDAWSRPASDTGVVYATLHNGAATTDRLLGASSPVATHVGLHESFATKMPGMSMPMGGTMMSMKPVAALPIPPHGSATLAPGGYHLMLDLRRDLKPGESFPLRLHFARAGWVDVRVSVRPMR